MALIDCEECGTKISDKAKACIKCGAPIGEPHAHGPKVVTTQQTGKKYKGLQLLGALLISAGVVSCTAKEPGAAAGLWITGLIVYLGARFSAWWNHG
ncbi:MAG: zinc ribbon domain-containing protein [Anaerolineales bacterium]